MGSGFEGFRPEALAFLVGLALNNDRSWFQPRKADYERLLREPMERFCLDLDEELRARAVPLSADLRSPFRIYRDVRFSRDKSPYKTNVAASFRWTGDGGGVGGYFSFEPGGGSVGGGMYHPAPPRLAAWRAAVVGNREAVHAALRDPGFVATFGTVRAETSLKRAPSGYAADDPDVELLKLRDVIFGRSLSDGELLDPALPTVVAAMLGAAVPVLRFLAMLPGHETGAAWLRE
jgi:uncharacterized protein (TIGR02453 family)